MTSYFALWKSISFPFTLHCLSSYLRANISGSILQNDWFRSTAYWVCCGVSAHLLIKRLPNPHIPSATFVNLSQQPLVFVLWFGLLLLISWGYGYTALIFMLHPHWLKEQINVQHKAALSIRNFKLHVVTCLIMFQCQSVWILLVYRILKGKIEDEKWAGVRSHWIRS